MARFWVVGGTGFLGRHLLAELQHAGHEIVACSRLGGEVHGLPVQAVDALDEAQVASSAEGCEYALVALGGVSHDPAQAEALHRVHVQGTRSVLQGLAQAQVRRVVYVSTSGTVAVSDRPQAMGDESGAAPLSIIGRWPYYRSKLFGEREALGAARPGFDVLCVNPSLLLGPGDVHESSTGDVRKFLEQRIPAVPRGGLSFVDVRDVARTTVAAAAQGRAGERYLLTAKNLTVEGFFDRLERLSGVPAPKLKLPASRMMVSEGVRLVNRVLRSLGGRDALDAVRIEMAQYYWYCSSDKAQRQLGFAPRDPADTLRDTVHDLIERGVAFPKVGHFSDRHSAA